MIDEINAPVTRTLPIIGRSFCATLILASTGLQRHGGRL